MSGRKPVLSGHMKKAIERLETLSGVVNLAIEVVDARAPAATKCELMTKVLRGCTIVTVFSKADLADPAATNSWIEWYRARGTKAVVFPFGKHKDRNRFLKSVTAGFREAMGPGEQVKAVVVGLPNVGKSTVMNMMTGGKRVRTGAMPGVTRGIQLINVDNDFLVLDTPGVVSSAVGDDERAGTLALVGCLQDKFYDASEAVERLLELCLPDYAGLFREFYDLPENPADGESFLLSLARRRGLLKKGGEYDLDRVPPIVLKDFSTGRLSGVTLERPHRLKRSSEG